MLGWDVESPELALAGSGMPALKLKRSTGTESFFYGAGSDLPRGHADAQQGKRPATQRQEAPHRQRLCHGALQRQLRVLRQGNFPGERDTFVALASGPLGSRRQLRHKSGVVKSEVYRIYFIHLLYLL